MKRGIQVVLGIFAACMIFQTMPVLASEGTEISIAVQGYSKSDQTLDVSCLLKNAENVTNGKVRIYYDSEKVILGTIQAGEILSGALFEKNDCLTGNKPEGEIVAVFASSQDIAADGSMLDMEFQLREGVEEGEKVLFKAEVEKLSGDKGDIEVENAELLYVVGENAEEESEKESEDNGGQSEDEKKDPPAGNGQNGNGNQNGNGQNGNGNQSVNDSINKSGVKTGDTSFIMGYLVLAIGSCLAVLGCAAARIRRKR